MCKTWLAPRAQWSALIVVIAVTLLAIPTTVQPTTASAAGERSPSGGSCSIYTAQHLATTLWRDPVSGTELTAMLFGYYNAGRFCGALFAEATLTLPAGYEAEWLCLTLHAGGQDACGAEYDLKWTCLTLQAGGMGTCGDLGPGPETGQHTFVLECHDRLENCDSVEASIRGFFTATVSTTPVCG